MSKGPYIAEIYSITWCSDVNKLNDSNIEIYYEFDGKQNLKFRTFSKINHTILKVFKN